MVSFIGGENRSSRGKPSIRSKDR